MCFALTEQSPKATRLQSKNEQQEKTKSSFDLLCSFSILHQLFLSLSIWYKRLKLNICMCQHIIKLCTWPYWPDLLNPLPQYNILTPSLTHRLHFLCINSLGTCSFISNPCLIEKHNLQNNSCFQHLLGRYWKFCTFFFFKETSYKK